MTNTSRNRKFEQAYQTDLEEMTDFVTGEFPLSWRYMSALDTAIIADRELRGCQLPASEDN